MAIVKVDYTKSSGGAKANIRYIEHRPGKEGARITRVLFGTGGQLSRQQAYGMIDQAEKGSRFFRIKISPDAKLEDTKQDLLLREITQKIMNTLEERVGKPVSWVAAIHTDHSRLRHMHALAIVKGRLNSQDLQLLRQAATEACLEQRRELDLARQQQRARAREEEQWELERQR